MPILIILLAAGAAYLLQNWVYKRYWSKNLHADVEFSDHYIQEGDETTIFETVSNGKILPMPWVFVKYQLKCNGKVMHYRSDLFSIRFYQQIRRKIPFRPEKRGLYTVRGIDLISNNLFITKKFVKTISDDTSLVVYPKLVSSDDFHIPYQKILGDIVTKRYMPEDPYMFKGIREYQPTDSFRSINFKASARAGKWLVNVHDFTVSQKVHLMLNLDRANEYYDARLYEYSISLAASLAQAFESDGIPLYFRSNGKDAMTGSTVEVEEGCGSGHLQSIMESLARVDLSLPVADYAPVLDEEAERADNARAASDAMFVLISPFFGENWIRSYLSLLDAFPDAVWLVPIRSADRIKKDFRPSQLEEIYPGIIAIEIDN